MTDRVAVTSCWCGSESLSAFLPSYLRCEGCGTLVNSPRLPPEAYDGGSEKGFYGEAYWTEHQEKVRGLPDIRARAWQDLPERCLYWLSTLIRHKPPPGKVLDVGCAHGGFVLLLSRAGYEARGMEMSPAVGAFANRTFGVEVLPGPIEKAGLPPASFDAVSMMDVVEHLPDPRATLKAVASLLKPDGVLLVQTPCAPEGMTGREMVRRGDKFLPMLLPDEHLLLLPAGALERLLSEAGLPHVRRGRPRFPYDQFLAAAASPLAERSAAEARSRLPDTPDGRLVECMLALREEADSLQAALDKRAGPLAWILEEVKKRLRKRRYAKRAASSCARPET